MGYHRLPLVRHAFTQYGTLRSDSLGLGITLMRVAIALIPLSARVIPLIHCSQVIPLIRSSGSSLGRGGAATPKMVESESSAPIVLPLLKSDQVIEKALASSHNNSWGWGKEDFGS